MHKAFTYRLYPNREQASALEHTLELHRRLYNDALQWRKTAYEESGKSVKYGEQSAALKPLRFTSEYFAGANFSSCQHTLRRLNTAFQNFFNRLKKGENPGYPRFKGIGRFNSVRFTYTDGCRLKDRKIVLQYIGSMKVKWHRELPEDSRITSVTIRRKAGEWCAVFHLELPNVEIAPSANSPVGIDLGLKSFLVTSDGEFVDAPQFFRKAQKKLRVAQRALSRKKKGGRRRKKAVLKVAKLHHHIGNQRKDFHHKTAWKLVNQYGFIAHENLTVQGLSRGMLAKSVNDAGWGNFLDILRFKAECAGVRIVGVNPAYTTQACSGCGCLPDKKIGLSVRT
jgi:putative transposase